MRICKLDCEKIVNEITDRYGLQNFYGAIYGSSTLFETNLLPMDLDLIVISTDLQQGGFEPKIREVIGDCHIYVISNEIFMDDVRTLAYGGYYCHKFALSFEPLIQRGFFLDAAKEYWSYELGRLEYKCGNEVNIEDIIRNVHRGIVAARPTFSRSLGKYLLSSDRKNLLIRFVQDLIQESSTFAPLMAEEIKRYGLGVESAYFRFWREWKLFHGNGNGTFNKLILEQMVMSMDCRNSQIVLDYIE